MFPVINRESVLSGFQWFFFIFCNTVVVPPTLLSAFHLPADNLLMLTQYAFLTTALACLVQAFCGHRRAIMEGPTGLWWGAILTITLGEASRGTPFFVRYGRVKIEDQIGEILGAKVVILLVGERPGLGQSESLSCYAVYSPRVATTVEADRTCISNIHQGGTPPVEAAAVIVDLAKRMLEQKASGINMTR